MEKLHSHDEFKKKLAFIALKQLQKQSFLEELITYISTWIIVHTSGIDQELKWQDT